MAVLDIRQAGDKVLKEKALPVDKIDKKVKRLLDDMAQTMYEADGVGLAAPQVGILQRVVVIDAGEGLVELINPEIIEMSDEKEIASEGCLSVVGVYGDVERSQKVIVQAINRNGKRITIKGTGMLARALQHEIDHLEGILFIEKAKSLTKRQ